MSSDGDAALRYLMLPRHSADAIGAADMRALRPPYHGYAMVTC